MSRTTTTPAEAIVDRIPIDMKHFQAVLERPLLCLPAEVRPSALRFWMLYKHLAGMESVLSVASRVSIWLDRDGLLPEDALAILERLLKPAEMAKFEFASQVLSRLAAEAAKAIDRRRTAAEIERRRQEATAYQAEIAKQPPQRLGDIRNSIGIPLNQKPRSHPRGDEDPMPHRRVESEKQG